MVRRLPTSSEYLGQVHTSRSSSQGQGHRSKKNMSVYAVRGWPARRAID